MKELQRLSLLAIIVFSLLLGISQAQATCDGQSFEDAWNAGYDANARGDFEQSIAYYQCAVALVPDDVVAEGGYARGEFYAGAFLNLGWAYFNNGDFDLVHENFYQWMRLMEARSFEKSLDEQLADGDLVFVEAGATYRLSFEGEAGQVWGFAASSFDATDPLLVLLDPNGEVLISDDDGGINLNSVIRRYTIPTTGTYTLVVGQAGAWGYGDVELAVYLDGEVRSSNPDNSNAIVNFATYYLYRDEIAEVFTTGGDNLNLRSGAGTDFEIIDRLESGERVTLLEGPLKREDGDGYSWWRVRTEDGLEGWAVERVETEQTLQLALFTGEEAIVVSAPDLLNVRETPSRSGALAFQLEDGASITILEDEPVIADGLRWWHIRDAEGREGWAVDRIGIERTIAPAREFPSTEG